MRLLVYLEGETACISGLQCEGSQTAKVEHLDHSNPSSRVMRNFVRYVP